MAKKTGKTDQTVIQDLRIEIRSVDRTRKDLSNWKHALESAENPNYPTRQLLYDLYEDIVLDDHLRSVMDQRRLAVTTSSIVFRNKDKEVESINELIDTAHFEKLLELALDSKFYGYSLIKADFINEKVELVPRAHVIPAKNIVVQRPYDLEGIPFNEPPFTYRYFGVGEPDDLGLILIAAVLVLIKRGDLSDWAQFNEIFGQPTRVGKYDPNSPGQREQLLEALKNSGAMAYLGIPQGAEIEFVEANKSGATDTYASLYDRMEAAISKVIVGQTMTTQNGSSRSQAEVHERVANKIAASDRKFVTRILNTFVRDILVAQGFSEAAKGKFQFVEEEEQLTKKARLEMDIEIHEKVGRLKKVYFAKEYNVEFVDDSDEPEQQPHTPPQPEPQPPATDPKKPEKAPGKVGELKKLLAGITDFFGHARQ